MMKKSLCLAASVLMLAAAVNPAKAESVEIQSITAHTLVGDGQREVYGFDIKVSDADAVQNLTAADFDIKNNGSSCIGNPDGADETWAYVDDELEVSVDGDVITLNFRPFRYPGMYTPSLSEVPWTVECTALPELTFTKADVTSITIDTLDDAYRGEFTYAGLTRKYALYVPKDEAGNDKTNLPLVIWNHGGGEYGRRQDIENTLIANRGLTAWNEEGYECAVLMIQVANDNYSYGAAGNENKKKLIDQNNALQAALVNDLIDQGTVDATRVYVTGASSGGGATMRFVMQNPELTAGAIAMCSMDPIVQVHYRWGADLEQITSEFEEAWAGTVYQWDEEAREMVAADVNTEALLNVPIYFTHAETDGTCGKNSSIAMYDSMANLGDENNMIKIFSDEEMATVGITNIANNGLKHWSWVKVFNETEEGTPMHWLFQQEITPEYVLSDGETETVLPEDAFTVDEEGNVVLSDACLETLAPGTYTITVNLNGRVVGTCEIVVEEAAEPEQPVQPEEPVKPAEPVKPQTGVNTGDVFNGGLLGGLMIAAAALACAAWFAIRRK